MKQTVKTSFEVWWEETGQFLEYEQAQTVREIRKQVAWSAWIAASERVLERLVPTMEALFDKLEKIMPEEEVEEAKP